MRVRWDGVLRVLKAVRPVVGSVRRAGLPVFAGALLFFCRLPLDADWVPSDPFPVGTKALALGGAFVSLADDAGAYSYNPAGIFQIGKNAFSYQFASMLKVQRVFDTSLRLQWEYLPLVALTVKLPDEPAALGISMHTFSRSLVESYTVRALAGSFSWRLLEDLAFGLSLGLAIGNQADNWATGLYTRFGVLYRVSPILKLGFSLQPGVSLAWDQLRGDLRVEQTLPLLMQGGFSWRLSEHAVLSFELEYQHLAGTRYRAEGVNLDPPLKGGLFRSLHPHLGFQFLHHATGAQVRLGLMTQTSAYSGGVDPLPLFTLGIGAYTSQFFRVDFTLLDTLLFDIFTKTDRYERFLLSFEYTF